MRSITAYSSGSPPKGKVHPLAIQVLRRNNLPVEQLRSKSWQEFANSDAPPLHFVFRCAIALPRRSGPSGLVSR
jgi:hypothetical protein